MKRLVHPISGVCLRIIGSIACSDAQSLCIQIFARPIINNEETKYRSLTESVFKNKLKYWEGHLVPKDRGYREIYLHTFGEKLSFSKDSYRHPSQQGCHLWGWTALPSEFQGPVTLSLKLFSIFLFLNVFQAFPAMIHLARCPKQRISPNVSYSPTVQKGKCSDIIGTRGGGGGGRVTHRYFININWKIAESLFRTLLSYTASQSSCPFLVWSSI